MTPLRLRMTEDMTLAGLAPGTQAVYIDAVRRLAEHYRRSPDRLTASTRRRLPAMCVGIANTRWQNPCTRKALRWAVMMRDIAADLDARGERATVRRLARAARAGR